MDAPSPCGSVRPRQTRQDIHRRTFANMFAGDHVQRRILYLIVDARSMLSNSFNLTDTTTPKPAVPEAEFADHSESCIHRFTQNPVIDRGSTNPFIVCRIPFLTMCRNIRIAFPKCHAIANSYAYRPIAGCQYETNLHCPALGVVHGWQHCNRFVEGSRTMDGLPALVCGIQYPDEVLSSSAYYCSTACENYWHPILDRIPGTPAQRPEPAHHREVFQGWDGMVFNRFDGQVMGHALTHEEPRLGAFPPWNGPPRQNLTATGPGSSRSATSNAIEAPRYSPAPPAPALIPEASGSAARRGNQGPELAWAEAIVVRVARDSCDRCSARKLVYVGFVTVAVGLTERRKKS